MAATYTPDPGHTPATITVPEDGDNLSANSVVEPLEDLADLVANARQNAAKTNVDNNFSVGQTVAELTVLGAALLKGTLSRETPGPSFTDNRVLLDIIGNGTNGHPFCRMYYTNTDALEFVFNGVWSEADGYYVRDTTGSRTTRYTFNRFGLVMQSYNGASATVSEADWTSALDLTPPTDASNKLLVGTSGSTIAFSGTWLESRLLALVNNSRQVVGTGVPFGANWGVSSHGRELSFMKDPLGFVRLEGQATCSNTGNDIVFVLPAGFRPSADVVVTMPVAYMVGGNIIKIIYINSAGEVTVPGASSAYVNCSFDNITFRVA